MTLTSLRVGQQAPDFEATAVVDQEFKNIKNCRLSWQVCGLVFLPSRLYLCLSYRDHGI